MIEKKMVIYIMVGLQAKGICNETKILVKE